MIESPFVYLSKMMQNDCNYNVIIVVKTLGIAQHYTSAMRPVTSCPRFRTRFHGMNIENQLITVYYRKTK